MFLKRIEILGFKSFADKTVVEFTDGITALLGPNGCGKSNIVDSIKWVLGEQSVRNMRAERMDDVIFSGTENRKALSHAEVTLVIANDSGLLEIERPEIAIKRRIFREGESEYFLNGTPVRLKEIRELFFDTGVGKSSYSIIEQGRIDQVISSRPEERRLIFEEAAGITKFRVRGSEAERKLARTEENMSQVENILHEVRRQYESLKKQTEKTLEYRKLREQAFELDCNLKLLQWKAISEKRQKKSERLESVSHKKSKVAASIDQIKTALADELDTVNQMESRLIEHQKELYGIDLEKSNQEEQSGTIRERRNEAEEARKNSTSREQNAVEALKSLSSLKKNREEDLLAFKERLAKIDGSILTSRKTIESAQKSVEGINDENSLKNLELTEQEKGRENLQEDLRQLTDDIVRELEKHLADSGYDSTTRRSTAEKIMATLKELKIRTEGRAKILLDKKNLADGESALGLLEGSAGDFNMLSESISHLSELFETYRNSGDEFLEEFLSPQGIITRKRELDAKILEINKTIKDLRDLLKRLSEQRRSLSAQIQQTRNSLEELRVAQARTTTQVAAAEDSLSSLVREIEAEETRLGEIRDQVAAEDVKIKNLDEQAGKLVEKRENLASRQKKINQAMSELEKNISSKTDKMTGREDSLKKLNEQRATLELNQERIRLEIDHLNQDERQLLEDFRDRNSRELKDVADSKVSPQQDSRSIRAELVKVNTLLKSMGHVNLMAPEEFSEVSDRYEFLNSQLLDLRKAKDDLGKVTEEMRRESVTLFMKTYKEIRTHFHDMFRRLFGGGRAEIRLLDKDDPLNSGLEIYAQPPGKKLENISLLSGGEKSLCAVGLVFALFLVRPSPFCLLDEIDAALDEANIQRFVNVLTEFGASSQFVIITHNKKTITGAQNLLGITMQESGVSRLISLKLNDEEKA